MKDKEVLQALLDGETIKIHGRMYAIRKNGTGDVLLANEGRGWEYSYKLFQFFLNNSAEVVEKYEQEE